MGPKCEKGRGLECLNGQILQRLACTLVGIICPGFWVVFTGAVDTSGLPLLGAWLIVFGVAWYILATISFAQGNLFGGPIYWHLGCIPLVSATFLVIAGLVFIGAAPAKLLGIAGWLALVVSAHFLYTASALVLNAMFERQVLPLGRSSETYTG